MNEYDTPGPVLIGFDLSITASMTAIVALNPDGTYSMTPHVRRRTLRPCSYPGCPVLVRDDARCSEHTREDVRRASYRGDSRKVYSSARWKQLRLCVLSEYPICQRCNRHPATEVHHVVPLPDCDPYDRSNLEAVCHACHAAEHAILAAQDGDSGGGTPGKK